MVSRKSNIKFFKKFEALTLEELIKLRSAHEKLLQNENDFPQTIKSIEKINFHKEKEYNEQRELSNKWHIENLSPLINEKYKLNSALKQFRLGLISINNIFGKSIFYENNYYKQDAEKIIKNLKSIELLLNSKYEQNPYKHIPIPNYIPYPIGINKIKTFRFKGVSCKVNFEELDLLLWSKLIISKKEELKHKEKKLLTLKAKVASNNIETRKIASTYKRKYPLYVQLEILDRCPYCSSKLEDYKPVLEHIFPVSMGGKSTESNLVWICNTCNMKKSSLTLSQFTKKYKISRKRIENKLDLLNKIY